MLVDFLLFIDFVCLLSTEYEVDWMLKNYGKAYSSLSN